MQGCSPGGRVQAVPSLRGRVPNLPRWRLPYLSSLGRGPVQSSSTRTSQNGSPRRRSHRPHRQENRCHRLPTASGAKKLRTGGRHSAQHPQRLSHRLAGPYPVRTRIRPKQRSHRKCVGGGESVSTRVSFRGLVPGADCFVRFAPHQSQDWNLSRFGHL